MSWFTSNWWGNDWFEADWFVAGAAVHDASVSFSGAGTLTCAAELLAKQGGGRLIPVHKKRKRAQHFVDVSLAQTPVEASKWATVDAGMIFSVALAQTPEPYRELVSVVAEVLPAPITVELVLPARTLLATEPAEAPISDRWIELPEIRRVFIPELDLRVLVVDAERELALPERKFKMNALSTKRTELVSRILEAYPTLKFSADVREISAVERALSATPRSVLLVEAR